MGNWYVSQLILFNITPLPIVLVHWLADAAAFLDAEVKPIVLEKFRKSNRQLADFMAKIKQQMAKDNWSTLCDSFSKLNLAKKVVMVVDNSHVVNLMYNYSRVYCLNSWRGEISTCHIHYYATSYRSPSIHTYIYGF